MNLLVWGSNSNGQLGLGISTEQEITPTLTNHSDIIVKCITGGGSHTILVDNTNRLFSCGNNDRHQSLDCLEKIVANFSPINIHLRSKVEKVSCGWDFSFCLLDDGTVFAWGANTFGQLGLPYERKLIQTPEKIPVEGCLDVSTGLRHTCLVSHRGTVLSSGSNSKGQLGIANLKPSTKLGTFTEVINLNQIVNVSCGEHFSLASTRNGKIYAWGENKFGQLSEDPSTLKASSVPITINLPDEVLIKSIHCGWSHCMILTDAGRIISWGRLDYGQLGEKRDIRWKPQYMLFERKLISLCVGSEHAIALTNDKKVVSWGWNEHGNCGIGEIENVWAPAMVRIPKDFEVTSIGTGYAHSFAIGSSNNLNS